jgi:hypothetical protein
MSDHDNGKLPEPPKSAFELRASARHWRSLANQFTGHPEARENLLDYAAELEQRADELEGRQP